MADLVFFYGTLMTPFNRTSRLSVDCHLTFIGRGSIEGALFDLGIYPAAIPSTDGRIWGEIYEMAEPVTVLSTLDELEGFRPGEQDSSLYVRALAPVTTLEGITVDAWAYFYNAPLGRAQRIASGDYLEHLRIR